MNGWLAMIVGMTLGASSLQTVATPQAPSLALDGEGSAMARIVKVATLSITSDAGLGFSLTVTSGALGNAEGQTPISFQVVTVPAQAAAPSPADFTSPSGAVYVFSTSAPGSVDRELYIRYQAAALQDPGAYAASLEVTVTDN